MRLPFGEPFLFAPGHVDLYLFHKRHKRLKNCVCRLASLGGFALDTFFPPRFARRLCSRHSRCSRHFPNASLRSAAGQAPEGSRPGPGGATPDWLGAGAPGQTKGLEVLRAEARDVPTASPPSVREAGGARSSAASAARPNSAERGEAAEKAPEGAARNHHIRENVERLEVCVTSRFRALNVDRTNAMASFSCRLSLDYSRCTCFVDNILLVCE